MSKPEYEDKFPDCLSMKLHGHTIGLLRFFPQLNMIFLPRIKDRLTKQIELKLTIRFAEQRMDILGGNIKFGLKGGELRLNLTNCKIALENLRLTPQLQETIEIEKRVENTEGSEDTISLTPRGGLTSKGNQAIKEVNKFKDEIHQVYTKGTEENPIWVFQIQTDKQIFIGGWQKKKIGILEANTKPCSVEALFELQDEDIRLTSATGIWPKDIGCAKTAWLQRELFLRWLRPKLKSYISRSRLLYE